VHAVARFVLFCLVTSHQKFTGLVAAMKTQEKRMGVTDSSSAQPRDDNFDFGLWSRLVRQQM